MPAPRHPAAPRVCLCQVNFPALPVARFVALAERAGAAAIDLYPGLSGETPEAVIEAVAGAGLEVILLSPLPDWWATTEGGRRLPPAVAPLIEVAAGTGGRLGVPSPLRVPGEKPPRPEAIGHALGAICAAAGEAGVGVALEPVGRSVMRAGARGAIGDLDQARELIRAHDLSLALVADSYCLASSGVDLTASWSTEGVCVVQIADWAGGEGGRVLPGHGDLPLARWLAAAEGPLPAVGLEVFPLADREDPRRLAEEMVRGARDLLAAVEGALP